MICLILSSEVLGKDKLVRKKILCVWEGSFTQFEFLKNNKVKVKQVYPTNLFVQKSNTDLNYLLVGENDDYLIISTKSIDSIKITSDDPYGGFYPRDFIIDTKTMRLVGNGFQNQCFFLEKDLDIIGKEIKDFIGSDKFPLVRHGEIRIPQNDVNTYYNKGTKFTCVEKRKVGFDFDPNNPDKSTPGFYKTNPFKFTTFDDIYQMIRVINSQLDKFSFLKHQFYDEKIYFKKKYIGEKEEDSYVCKIRYDKYDDIRKIDNDKLILECRRTLEYSNVLNLNMNTGRFIESNMEGNIGDESVKNKKIMDTVAISHGICEKM